MFYSITKHQSKNRYTKEITTFESIRMSAMVFGSAKPTYTYD
ncbi:hypothetical protein MNB_SV-6-1785 [hydrothermal vent metagenome]|uniref:Uncharacterized protein n=1 Tax=hydrothermal vent metagenome TaxID=652676 RepID=A0A1W1BAB2_9ZZZZ